MKNSKIDQLPALFFKTSRLIHEHIKPAKKTDPFTFLCIGTLNYILENKNPTMQEVAKFLFITPPSVTTLIEKLIKSGMVSRILDSKDRRVIRLKISPRGRTTVEKARKNMAIKIEEVFKKLDAKDINDLIRIMQKLNKIYKK